MASFDWSLGKAPQFAFRPANESEKSIFSQEPFEVVQDNDFVVPKSVKVLDSFYFQNLPVVIASDNKGQLYKIWFGHWIHADLAANMILEKLGNEVSSKKLASKIIIDTDGKNLQFFKFWNRSPLQLKLTDFFIKEENFLKTKVVMIEKIEHSGKKLKGWHFSKKPNLRESNLLLSLGLVQNGDLDPAINHHKIKKDGQLVPVAYDLRHSLGHSVTHSSVNMFRDRLITIDDSPLVIGKSRKAQFDLVVRNKFYQEAYHALDFTDFAHFAKKLKLLRLDELKDIFKRSGYPEVLAELYSRKIIDRKNDFLSKYKFVDHRAARLAKAYSYSPYIQNGELVRNIPGFQSDLLESTIENLFIKVGSEAWDRIFNLAAELLAHTPYTGIDKRIFGGKLVLGPSVTLRLERTVEENPNSRGLEDLFLVVDKITIGVVVGVGVEGKILKANGWAKVGPGYHRILFSIRPASSYKEGRKLPWANSFNKWLRPRYDEVKPGESLAVTNSIMFGAIAGGNSKIWGSNYARLGGYILTGANYSWGTQATLDSNMRWTFMNSTEQSISFQSKLYFRAINRLFRVPISSIRSVKGQSHLEARYIDQDLFELMDDNEKMETHRQMNFALSSGDVSELSKPFEKVSIDSKFDSLKFTYNFVRWKSEFLRSEAYEKVSHQSKKEPEFFYVSKESRFFRTAEKERKSCEAVGVAKFKNSNRTVIEDSALHLKCKMDFISKNSDYIDEQVMGAFQSFNQSSHQKLTNKDKFSSTKAIKVSFETVLGEKDLLQLYLPKSKEELSERLSKARAFLKHLPVQERLRVMNDYQRLLSFEDIEDKLDLLVLELRHGVFENHFRQLIMHLIKPHLKIVVFNQNYEESIIKFGNEPVAGPALNYIEEIKDNLGDISIRSF